MKKDKASWTAEMTAAFRATETIRPRCERLIDDPYAVRFLRPALQMLLKSRALTRLALWFMVDRRFPGASVTIVSRIRFVDDCLKAALESGLEQLVILGAGFDSRAYRFAQLKRHRVFEVDHPNTQRLKIEKVARILGGLPDHVHYVPVDFESQALMPKLKNEGYNPGVKTLFIWEGVCKYLTEAAVSELLTAVSAGTVKGSAIVFDYLFESMITNSASSPLTQRMLDYQANKGEPFIFGLPEKSPEAFVKPRGFSEVKNTTAAAIRGRYFQNRKRARHHHTFWGMIQATV